MNMNTATVAIKIARVYVWSGATLWASRGIYDGYRAHEYYGDQYGVPHRNMKLTRNGGKICEGELHGEFVARTMADSYKKSFVPALMWPLTFWKASHIGCVERLESLRRALCSVANNTVPPHSILLSYSSFRDAREYVAEELWRKTAKGVPLTILFQHGKQLQLDHYQLLLPHVQDEDVVCFLDDDDLYAPGKIERVQRAFGEFAPLDIYAHGMCQFGMDILFDAKRDDDYLHIQASQGVDPRGNFREYFCYCVKGYVLRDFMQHWYPHIAKCGMADLELLTFLQFDDMLPRECHGLLTRRAPTRYVYYYEPQHSFDSFYLVYNRRHDGIQKDYY